MASTKNITEKEVQLLIQGKLSRYFGVSSAEATKEQIYKAVVMSVRDILLEKRQLFHKLMMNKKGKRVYYLCMEFLLGRSLKNNVYNLGLAEEYEKALKHFNLTLEDLYEQEPDAGLGNGGLGRLAACFMDALATGNYPAMGYSIRYDYGLFKQKIVDGWQTELPDIWLPGGEVWLTQRSDKSCTVKFDGWVREDWSEHGLKVTYGGYKEVEAVAYDMMISGKDSEAVSVLRLWRARNISRFDMKLFSQGDYLRCMQEENEAEVISKVLYPADDHYEGKSLRLKQQYFLVSASLQNIVNDHKHRYGPLSLLPQQAAIHINDTHPALAIPELMRILMDDYAYEWDDAWNIVTNVISYTNHTVLAEALEKWPISYIQQLLPRVYMIIEEIHRRFEFALDHQYNRPDIKYSVAILKEGQVHMANLAIVGSHHVNGVAGLHTEILKNDVFKSFYEIMPEKFSNKTNGITHRRWLLYSNPQLTHLLDETIGKDYQTHPEQLEKLMAHVDDPMLQAKFMDVKRQRKQTLADYIKETLQIEVDVNSIFDVQAKRLHAYKRQLLNVLHIIYLYQKMKKDPNFRIYPRTFIFAAKAAPAYTFAKQVIKLINCIADVVNNDSQIAPYMKVVFIPNYGVSIAEILMNAADVSEQISTAGKEASGTGNMKFMMNGAITLGTLDGANVEIVERVGYENAEIFGLRADDVALLKRENVYSVWNVYNRDPEIKAVVEALVDGTFSPEKEDFRLVYNELMFKNDEYLLLADFDAYKHAQTRVQERYQDKAGWAKMCLINIAKSGFFSSDRTIKQYADEIWNIQPIEVK